MPHRTEAQRESARRYATKHRKEQPEEYRKYQRAYSKIRYANNQVKNELLNLAWYAQEIFQ